MASQTELIEIQPVSHTFPPIKEVKLNPDNEVSPMEISEQYPKLSPLKSIIVCIAAAGVTAVCSMTTGVLTTGLPAIAEDLGISDGLILWPAAIYSLTSGCTFIVIGSIADVIGARLVYLFGCLFLFLTILACGLAQTALQMIIFRGLQGIAASCCLPTAISILSSSFAPGRARTRGMAIQGSAFPLGYAIGLFMGGVFVDTIGWRWGWYITAICSILVFVSAIWAIPKDSKDLSGAWKRVLTGIDWMGAFCLSASLGLISYTLAVLSGSADSIKEPVTITLLVLGIVLGIFSFWWMSNQEKHGRVSLIPSSVWSNRYFSVTCATMFLVSVVINSSEFFFSLFFQKVKDISALQASVRFLPEILIGVANSFAADAFLHKWSAYWFVLSTCAISAIAPLFMAFMMPQWSYWYMEFWAMCFLPVGNDVLFVVAALIITDTFPTKRQALGGSILSAVCQFGTAVGLGTMSVASSVVTFDSGYLDKTSPAALLEGYRATFWTCFGASIFYCALAATGLRGVGKVGLKSE